MEFSYIELLLYFLPAFAAMYKKKDWGLWILGCICFSWTIIGWVILLLYALQED